MERVTAWGVENAVGFDFKTLLQELAQENLEEYTKTFFQEGIEDWRGLRKQEQLEIALGQALREFLLLVQQELEDADCSEEERQQYAESLRQFLHDKTVLVELGKPFQAGVSDADKLEQTWQKLNLLALPDEFDWKGIAKRYKKKVDAIVRESEELLAVLSDEATAEVASDSDLIGYRKAIEQRYGYLKLDTLHTSGYSYRLQLLNIFVAQDVREVKEALPQLLELPKEHLKRLIKTGDFELTPEVLESFRKTDQLDAEAIKEILERYKRSYVQETARSVSELIEDGQTYPYLVILGDPGSGKSSLVQYIALQWASSSIDDESSLPLPLLIELRRYVQSRDKQKCQNFLEFCQQSHGFIYPLHPQKLEERLRTGNVFVLFDGLDEVFEASKRNKVITEIIRFTKDYPQVRVLVTSRVIGYQPQRLRKKKFRHFMLQDLELEQIEEFLTRWHELAFGAGEEAQLLHYPPNPPYQGGNQNLKLASPLPEQEGNQNLKLASPLPEQEGNQNLELASPFLEQEGNQNLKLASPLPEQEGNQSWKLASPLGKGGLLAKRHEVRGVNNDSSARSEEGKKKQERLQQAIEESPAIRQLAGNPLLLTMMAILNRNQELPRNRAELYSQASKVLLQQWDVERALIQKDAITIDFKDKQAMLRRVAYQMQGNDKGLAGNLINAEDLEGILRDYLEKNLDISDAGSNAKSIVKQLRERNFILCFLGADYYAFVHRMFLEYFCAWEFVWKFQKERSLSLEELKTEVFGRRWQDESWHEVLRLIAGMLNENFTGEIINYLSNQNGKEELYLNLFLATNCISELRNRTIYKAVDAKLLVQLKELVESSLDESRKIQSEIEELENSEIHNQRHAQKVERLLRQGLGYEILVKAVRLIATTWKDDPDTLLWLKNCVHLNKYPALQETVLQELSKGWRNELEVLIICAENMHNPDKRKLFLQEVIKGFKDSPNILSWLKNRAQHDKSWAVRQAAMHELIIGWKDDPDTLRFFKAQAKCDEWSNVRRAAVQDLAEGWKEQPYIFEFLCDCATNDPFKRRAYSAINPRQTALEAIIRHYPNHPQTLPLLRDRAKNDPDEQVRKFAKKKLKNWT